MRSRLRVHAFAGGDLTLWPRRFYGQSPVLRRRATARRVGLLSIALACTSAAADPEANADVVRLSIPDCEAASGAQIAKLVGLELASHRTIVEDDARPATMRASLRCASSQAVITVEDSRRPNPLVLRLDLEGTRSEARPRLLALAVAELIATSRLERTPARSPAVPRQRRWAPRSSLWLSTGVLRANEPAAWLPAIEAGGAYDIGLIALAGDVAFDWNEQAFAEAIVSARTLSLSFVPTLPLITGRFRWGLGFGLRAGYAWLTAAPREPNLVGRDVAGVFVSPVLQSAQEFGVVGPVFCRLALELGYVVQPVRGFDADRIALLEVRGLRLSALLGVGVSL